MAYLNIALFAAVLPAAFAMPQHAHMGHGPYKGRSLPSGFPTSFPRPSGIPGTASFPVGGNGTVGGPTATGAPLSTGGAGAGPVTIQSTINIIPLPASSGPAGVGSSPMSGAGGIGSSPTSGSADSGSSPSGAPGSGPGGLGESGASCGPSTITITKANTVTVTIPAPSGGSGGAPSGAPIESSAAPAPSGGSGGAPSGAPIESSAAASSPVLAPSSAPFPIGNSSVPAGPTGTGTVGTGLPSIPYQAPIVSSTPASSTPVSSTPVSSTFVDSTPVSSTPVVAQSSGVVGYPASVPVNSAPVQAYNAPAQAATSAVSSTSSPTSSVVAPELLRVPGGEQRPAAPVTPASVTPASIAPASVTPSVTPAVASSVTPSSSAAVSSSAAPVTSNGKARGLLYGGNNGQLAPAEALSAANSYLSASNGAVGWCWNWDSSPSPSIGWTTGTTTVEFVPMLWGLGGHVTLWPSNVAAIKPTYAMGFNEPDMTTDKGGCQLNVADAVQGWKDNMEPLKSSGIKLVTPGTTNDLTDSNMGHGYMTQFLEACTGCHFDVLTFHYYGEASDISALRDTVTKYQTLQKQHNIGELWISEMAPNEAPTTEQMAAFLKFLDDPSNGVARYAFNGLNTGNGQSLTGPVIKAAYQA